MGSLHCNEKHIDGQHFCVLPGQSESCPVPLQLDIAAPAPIGHFSAVLGGKRGGHIPDLL